MNLIREFMLILLLTAITGSILMVIWMAAVYSIMGRRNIHYAWWMLRGVLAGYLIPLVYLFVHRCIEIVRNDYDILSVSNAKMDKAFLVLFFIWVVGVFYRLLSQLHIWSCFRRITRGSMAVPKGYHKVLQRLCIEMGIQKKVSLYQGYGVESPFIFGAWNPKIYLPVREFSEEELEMVLYHELVHYKQGDTFWKPFFGFLGNLYWFSPLSRLLWNEVIRWTEANCDFYCCKERFQAKKYFLLLLEMGSVGQNRLNSYMPMWTEGSRELEWRVKRMKNNKMKKTSRAVVAAIVVIAILSSGLSAHAAAEGMKKVYYEVYSDTVEETEEPYEDGNKLQEYEGTVEDFAGMEVVEHTGEITAYAATGTIDWTVGNGAIHYSDGFKVSAGGTITVTIGVEPNDRTVKVGIVKPDGTTSYVTGKKFISHVFSVSKAGTYKVFVSNSSGKKVTVSGSYTIL